MEKPTIHINGTGASSLLAQYADALHVLSTAEVILRRCTPNGRDYYPQGAYAINRAIEEHLERLRKLQSVRDEINELAEHCIAAM